MEAPKGKLALLPDVHDLWAERPAAADAQRQDEVPALPSRRDTRDFDAGGDRPEGHGGVSVRAGAGRAHVNVRAPSGPWTSPRPASSIVSSASRARPASATWSSTPPR